MKTVEIPLLVPSKETPLYTYIKYHLSKIVVFKDTTVFFGYINYLCEQMYSFRIDKKLPNIPDFFDGKYDDFYAKKYQEDIRILSYHHGNNTPIIHELFDFIDNNEIIYDSFNERKEYEESYLG